MEKCKKCNQKPIVTLSSVRCPKCNAKICNSCFIKSKNKCPYCNNPHMIKIGGVEDNLKKKE